MMIDFTAVLITWALINVLFVFCFLWGGWRRTACKGTAPYRPAAGGLRRDRAWEDAVRIKR
jgi:hypothetical protein